ncbi:hypothetical protein ASD15_29930 [Massilia sp. Root351]|nr:hypothetical protein ASD15_29930 [Massilia sp. Root351]
MLPGSILIAIALLVCSAAARADESSLTAPNVVAISPTIVTSGQPTAASLAALAGQGFKAVVYLAPPTVPDAVTGEADIVRRQGLEFVNIPIEFGEPTEADFEQFAETMSRFQDRKVLVHCQVNMRASTLTFLYRVIKLREPPEQAYQAVARVWSPRGAWNRLLTSQLRKAGIEFEPY